MGRACTHAQQSRMRASLLHCHTLRLHHTHLHTGSASCYAQHSLRDALGINVACWMQPACRGAEKGQCSRLTAPDSDRTQCDSGVARAHEKRANFDMQAATAAKCLQAATDTMYDEMAHLRMYCRGEFSMVIPAKIVAIPMAMSAKTATLRANIMCNQGRQSLRLRHAQSCS